MLCLCVEDKCKEAIYLLESNGYVLKHEDIKWFYFAKDKLIATMRKQDKDYKFGIYNECIFFCFWFTPSSEDFIFIEEVVNSMVKFIGDTQGLSDVSNIFNITESKAKRKIEKKFLIIGDGILRKILLTMNIKKKTFEMKELYSKTGKVL